MKANAFSHLSAFILHPYLSVFLTKLALEQLPQLRHGLLGVFAIGVNAHFRALGGGEDDHLHHALAVRLARLLAELVHADVALELVGQIHELHRRPRVQPELVGDDDVTRGGRHGRDLRFAICNLRLRSIANRKLQIGNHFPWSASSSSSAIASRVLLWRRKRRNVSFWRLLNTAFIA